MKYFWQFETKDGRIWEVQVPMPLVGHARLKGVNLIPEIGRWVMTLTCDDGAEVMIWMPVGYPGECVNTGWREEKQ